MNNWKWYLKDVLLFMGIVLGVTLLISTLSFFTNISSKIISLLILIGVIGAFFFLGYQAGRKASSKGYIVGLGVGAVAVLVMFILSAIFWGFHLGLSKIIYYVVLILSSTIGSMVGINKK